MTLSLFYNVHTRGAAIGDVTRDNVVTSKVYPDDSFGSWTHIVQFSSGSLKEKQKLFFFNRENGAAVIGNLKEDGFTPTDIFQPGSFDTWTHIAAVDSLLFFYDKYSGAAAIASTEPETIELLKTIDPDRLSGLNSLLLEHPSGFNKIFKGPVLPGTNLPDPAAKRDFVTITSFNRGSFGEWTHVVACGSYLFFYNQDSGAASVGRLSQEPLTTAKDYATGAKAVFSSVKDYAGGMGTWTHIASGAPYLLFYNQKDGSAKIGELSEAGLTTVKGYKPGSFGDWTHLVSQEKPFSSISSLKGIGQSGGFPGIITPPKDIKVESVVLFYNAASGAGALGVLDNNDLTVTKGFEEGKFGTWTTISDPSSAVDPLDLGYQLIRTGTGVRIMNHDGTYTDANVTNNDLTPEEQEKAIDLIYGKMDEFIKRNTDAIINGDIKAEDIGGELYGVASAAIVAIFAPFAGLPLIDELIAKPFEELSKNAGRFYGAMVDELANTLNMLLNNAEGKPKLSQILGTLATVHLMGKYVPGVPALGTDAWSLTKEIGAELGDAVEDTLESVVGGVGDAIDLGADAADDAVKFVGDLLGL